MKIEESRKLILSIRNPDALAIIVIVAAFEIEGKSTNPIEIQSHLKISSARFNAALSELIEKQGALE